MGWMSDESGLDRGPANFAPLTPLSHLQRAADVFADRPALAYGDTVWTYAQYHARVSRLAGALADLGVAPGDVVATLLPNVPAQSEATFAVPACAAVLNTINTRLDADTIAYILGHGAARVAIVDSASVPLVEAAIALMETPAPIVIEVPDIVAGIPATGRHRLYEDLVAQGDPAFDWVMPQDEWESLALNYTSGTTGRPKGVRLTGTNLETMTAITLMSYPWEGRPVYLALAPLTHAAGVLCFPVLASAGEIVVMRVPDIGGFLEHLERHRVTHTFLPPTLIYMVLAHDRLDTSDLSSLQCFWYGAAPMSAARLEEALTRIGPVMAQLFGQTEAPMMISTMAPRDHFRTDGSVAGERLSSAGRPAPLVTVAVMDDEGALLPREATGEIVVRGSLVMAGYHRDPEATAAASTHGWHHTGDIGYLDGDGFLFIVDRAKDMVITGGFNVYSTEVEQAVMAHPAVQDCAVVGLPDEKWGERVTAVVQLRSGTVLDQPELVSFVKARIGSVKTPKQVEVWVDLPRSKIGKVLKADIRRELLGG